jgi:hypothetical protein
LRAPVSAGATFTSPTRNGSCCDTRRNDRTGSTPKRKNGPVNPDPGDPPHLLVIEHVDEHDPHESMLYLQCPFPTGRLWRLREYEIPLRRFNSIEDLDEDCEPVTIDKHEAEVHLGRHYCTTGGVWSQDDRPRPALSFVLRWREATLGHGEKCARVEFGARSDLSYGNCYYHEVCSNVGLLEALGAPWHLDRWSDTGLPNVPGEYPVYYWSDGWGDGFCDGLTLDPP